jgi:L-rhamnose mutarotase
MKPFVCLSTMVLSAGVIAGCLFGCGQPSATKTDSVAVTSAKSKPILHPIIIEIILPKNTGYNDQLLADAKWLSEEKAEITDWKNHIAIFLMRSDTTKLMEYIKGSIHGSYDSVKIYDKPFYKFDRSKCSDTTTSKEWTNIFLTANLVADPKMQQEYLDYHKTQFEKWPEVSNGFCNANFQQLLVFKNGRQLMLVISIPKGKTLDELNPLTTKNNPRVDDWNKLMSKYQEGLPGTKKRETWVFLKPI